MIERAALCEATEASPSTKHVQRFNRDGWDADIRFGAVVPHADVGPECELYQILLIKTYVPRCAVRWT